MMQKLCVLLGYFAYLYANEEFSANQFSGVLVNMKHLNSSPGILVSSIGVKENSIERFYYTVIS
jgi:hypothetical protein